MNKFLAFIIIVSVLFLAYQPEAKAFIKYPRTRGSLCTKKDKHFKELRYKEKIPYCRRVVNASTRKKVYASYGIKWADRIHFTVDHIIPLSLGSSNNMDNLWPEHLSLKMKRGKLENDLYLKLNRGEITADQAQWIIVYAKTTKGIKRYCGSLKKFLKIYKLQQQIEKIKEEL